MFSVDTARCAQRPPLAFAFSFESQTVSLRSVTLIVHARLRDTGGTPTVRFARSGSLAGPAATHKHCETHVLPSDVTTVARLFQ